MMKVFIEREKNIRNFYWVNEEYKKNEANLSKIHSIVINAEAVISYEDVINFLRLASAEIYKMFSEPSISEYYCYIICKQTIEDENSKVHNYKKVWKYLVKEWAMDTFRLGEEVKIKKYNDLSYYGIAKTDIKSIEQALKMISLKPSKFAVFISCRDIKLSAETTKEIVDRTFVPVRKLLSVSNYNLCTYLCDKGDVVVRWGESSNEIEIALMFNSEQLKL